MATVPHPKAGPRAPRRALLAGATGLVGRALLDALLHSAHYRRVDALVRRAPAGLPADPRLHLHEVDFAALPPLPATDDVYIALGTTIKAAGSQAAFRRVDFDAVVRTAAAARQAGAHRLAVVSALGADAASPVFYNRVKGEMEAALRTLGYEVLAFARPSLLVGDRSSLGQPPRPAERWALRLLGPALGFVPRAIRPIPASDVARTMLMVMLEAPAGVHVLPSALMLRRRR